MLDVSDWFICSFFSVDCGEEGVFKGDLRGWWKRGTRKEVYLMM